MEADNPIIKYIFPFIMFLQYFGCDSHHEVVPYEYTEPTSKVSVVEDCSELNKYTYNGFYSPSKEGKMLYNSSQYSVDSMGIAKEPLITFQDVDIVIKSYDVLSKPSLVVHLNEKATSVFKEYTAKNIGEKIAIVIKDSLISAPIIQSEIAGGKVQITSSFTQQEVDNLYNYLFKLKDCK